VKKIIAELSVILILCLLMEQKNFAQNLEWANTMSGSNVSYSRGVCVDDAGNVYVTGGFGGSVDFNPGAGNAVLSSNNGSVFLSKYDSQGNYLWAIQIAQGFGYDVKADFNGYIYVTGYFFGSCDFDPGVDSAYLSSNGISDAFIAKYDQNGNYIWAIGMGGTKIDEAYRLELDIYGNVYFTGQFKHTVDFDPGPDTAYLSTDSIDFFIAKYDINGNFNWANTIQSSILSSAYDLIVDDSGNVFISGIFQGDAYFGQGAGTDTLSSNGLSDAFFAKYDQNGDYVWACGFGSTQVDVAWNIELDDSNNILLNGNFRYTVDFDPGAGVYTLTSAHTTPDIFFAKYSPNAELIWVKRLEQNGFSNSFSFDVDNQNNIYLSGSVIGTVDLDPGTAIVSHTFSNYNIYFAKYDKEGNYIWGHVLEQSNQPYGECYSMAVDELSNIYLSGLLLGTIDFDPGVGVFNQTNSNSGIYIAKYSQTNTAIGSLVNESNLYVKVFPNPAEDYVQIVFTLPTTDVGVLRMLDLQGRVIWQKQVEAKTKQLSIDLSPFASGAYLLNYQSKNTRYSYKLLHE
jgi:hypothetical protein